MLNQEMFNKYMNVLQSVKNTEILHSGVVSAELFNLLREMPSNYKHIGVAETHRDNRDYTKVLGNHIESTEKGLFVLKGLTGAKLHKAVELYMLELIEMLYEIHLSNKIYHIHFKREGIDYIRFFSHETTGVDITFKYSNTPLCHAKHNLRDI